MQLPEELFHSLKGLKGFDEKAFREVHRSGEQVTSIRFNPFKPIDPLPEHLIPESKIPWTDTGFYLPKRPSFTFDPLFHAGCYYVQEASSMFLEQAIKQTTDLTQSLKVLDLCAAPGGKSTHLLSLVSRDSLLVSNEIIKSRSSVLLDNLTRWGCSNMVVTNNDPRDFGLLTNFFDVLVVDAPCSGSGLFRKDPSAINEWSFNNVALCCQRQRRILANAIPSLKEGGLLIYSTCSYSKEEDEDIANWLEKEMGMRIQKLEISKDWGIEESEEGYRFFPYKLKGEGFYLTCFRKIGGEKMRLKEVRRTRENIPPKQVQVIQNWVKTPGMEFINWKENIYMVPAVLMPGILQLEKLRILSKGTNVGSLVRDKLIPNHMLALSHLVSDAIPRAELDMEQSIRYLQKKDINFENVKTGWYLVTYMKQQLGWINVLTNRINNYYPRELRILKDQKN